MMVVVVVEDDDVKRWLHMSVHGWLAVVAIDADEVCYCDKIHVDYSEEFCIVHHSVQRMLDPIELQLLLLLVLMDSLSLQHSFDELQSKEHIANYTADHSTKTMQTKR